MYKINHEPFYSTLIGIDYQIQQHFPFIFHKFPDSITELEKIQVLECLQMYGNSKYKFYLSNESWCGKLINFPDKTC